MLEWVREHFWWTFALSVVILVGTVVLVPLVVARLPQDHFVRPEPGRWSRRHSLLRGALWIGRNLLGAVLIVAGIAMLVLPGQGILTILIGLLVLEFPGKRALELRLARRPRVRRAIDWIRAKAGRPPLLLPD
jgi:ABC-type sugar transport system permease subunit